jgi:hypothetical protein
MRSRQPLAEGSGEIPFTGLLNGFPKFVASRTLAGPIAWRGSTLVAGDLAESIPDVKERHDEVHVIGSLDLVRRCCVSALSTG